MNLQSSGASFSYFKWQKKKNGFHLPNSSFIHVNGFFNCIFTCVKRPEYAEGSRGNCQLSSFLSGAENDHAPEGSSLLEMAGPKQGRWGPLQLWLGLRSSWAQDFPEKMDKIRLFLVVLKALPNTESLGANSWMLTLSRKWDETLKGKKEGQLEGGQF